MGLTDDAWLQKLSALLHDPPHKAVCLSQHVSHENEATRIAQALGCSSGFTRRVADHLAAAGDRPAASASVPLDWLADPCVIRPTGGTVTWLDHELRTVRGEVDARQLTEEIIGTLVPLRELPPRERFIAAWRLLPELVSRSRDGMLKKVGPLWHVFPADTRVPNHSIWSHNRMASAWQGALPRPALFEFRIGPVQSILSAARRTKDLTSSSWLLSFLIGEVGAEIAKAVGPDAVIFPDLYAQPLIDRHIRKLLESTSLRSNTTIGDLTRYLAEGLPTYATLPNRLVVLLPASEIERIGNTALQIIVDTMKRLAGESLTLLRSVLAEKFADLDSRLSNHFDKVVRIVDCAWAAVELPADTGEAGYEELRRRFDQELGDRQLLLRLDRSTQQRVYDPNIATGYPLIYTLLQAAINARKSLRSAEPWDADEERCTVCTERPSIPLVSTGRDRSALREAWRRLADALLKNTNDHWLAEDGDEMLCGLCFIRRGLSYLMPRVTSEQWNDKDFSRFPSTAGIATAVWRAQLDREARSNPTLKSEIAQFVGVCKTNGALTERPLFTAYCEGWDRVDGRILFTPSNSAHVRDDELDSHIALSQAFRNLATALRRDELSQFMGRPPRYYAVLAFDGDNMGKWLSGTVANPAKIGDLLHLSARDLLRSIVDEDQLIAPSQHAGISATLRDFSLYGVPAFVRRGYGALIYAGGDDVLAMLPVETVLETARDIRRAFSEGGVGDGEEFAVAAGSARGIANPSGYIHYWLGTGKITGSAGIAIAHYMADLRVVMECAREIEERAKSEGGRDCLGIAVLKRSGERREAFCPWGEDDWGVITLIDLMKLFRKGKLSPRIIREVEFDALLAAQDNAEILRHRLSLLMREHAEGATQTDIETLVNGLLEIWCKLKSRSIWSTPLEAWQRGPTSLFSVAAFMARGSSE